MQNLRTSLPFLLLAFILCCPQAAFSQANIPTPEFPTMCQTDIGVPTPYPTTTPPSAVVPPGTNAADLARVYPSARGLPDLCGLAPQYRMVVPNNPGAPIVPKPIVTNPNTPTAVVPSPNVTPTNAPPGPAYVYPYPYGIGNVTAREWLRLHLPTP
jgi:hypothetical protein